MLVVAESIQMSMTSDLGGRELEIGCSETEMMCMVPTPSKKVSVVGVGGVGSWIAEFLARAGIQVEIIDGDEVEEKNLGHSNYSEDDASLSRFKVSALADRIKRIGGKVQERVAVVQELESNGSDLFILCVDSIAARISLLSSLEKLKGQKWIDCRAEGRRFQIFTHASRMINEFLSVKNPTVRRSCQIEGREIEAGNLMCASVATQLALDIIREKEYPPEVIVNEYI